MKDFLFVIFKRKVYEFITVEKDLTGEQGYEVQKGLMES